MTTIKNILLPLDFSEAGVPAAMYARQLARKTQSKITLLHVSEDDSISGSAGGRPEAGPWDWLQAPGPASVLQRIEALLGGLEIQRVVLNGDPADTISRHARETGADLIVMPTRGVGAVRRFLLGSVTAKVLHDVDCPVLTVLEEESAESNLPDPEIRRVACALDLDAESAGVLAWAGGLARMFGASLTILHASPQLEPMLGVPHEPEWRVHLSSILTAEIEQLKKAAGIEAEIRLEGGEPAKTVAAMAGEIKADVLVIGRPASSRFLGRLRTHSYAIIRQSPCPVISV